MANSVVCCDGTWNKPGETDHGLPAPTNVVKLYNALVRNDPAQKVYYHPGVGTGRSLWNRIAGGGLGEGLDQNIKSAYRWLGSHYTAGDDIFLFGFSRGAYTARSLGGLITRCGLLDLSAPMTAKEVWKRVDEVFAAYRAQTYFANRNGYPFHNAPAGQPAKETTPIHFIGVWDTVGALGIPEDFAFLWLLDNPAKYRFCDTQLSHIVRYARHAVALDEHRATFAPTLWSDVKPPTDMKQIWFPGVHGDVGGGYFETGLSDGALFWMIDEAVNCGLKFAPDVKKQLRPEPLGVVHDSVTSLFKVLKTKPRPAPPIPLGSAVLHQSTVTRNANTPLPQGDYWPTRALAPGTNWTGNIYAVSHWNHTGLYLEAGRTYTFSAAGQWVDHKDHFGPAGGHASGFTLGNMVRSASSVAGYAETMFNDLTGYGADFWLTRRDEWAPWFALMGFVANAVGEDAKTLAKGETFLIGAQATFTPKLGGYLYCYANDAWQTYGNNRGSVRLTVTG